MRMDLMSTHDLLRYFTKKEYGNKPVLVIWNPLDSSLSVLNYLKERLEGSGILPPANFFMHGHIFIKVEKTLGQKNINDIGHGTLNLELY